MTQYVLEHSHTHTLTHTHMRFGSLGSIVFFGWTLYNSWDTATNNSWENFWVQEAFLHILFTFVLVGILVLWRPTMNNSRYAYAALETDLLEDEEYHVVPNFGADTVKSRTLSSRGCVSNMNSVVCNFWVDALLLTTVECARAL